MSRCYVFVPHKVSLCFRDYTGHISSLNRVVTKWQAEIMTTICSVPLTSYHIIMSYYIAVLKWQNHLKVGTDKPKPKVKMQSVSGDDVWKRLIERHFWAGGERCIQTGKMLHLLARRSRSSGQQLEKHGYRWLIAWQKAPEDDWCL